MKPSSLALAAAAFAALAGSASAQLASAVYDFSTGGLELTIAESSDLGVVGFESASGALRPDALSDALTAAQATANVIAFLDTGGLPAGTFDLGNVVTPGTAGADLSFGFTPNGGASVLGDLEVVNVPEPASLALLGLGAATLLRRAGRGQVR